MMRTAGWLCLLFIYCAALSFHQFYCFDTERKMSETIFQSYDKSVFVCAHMYIFIHIYFPNIVFFSKLT